MSFRESISVLLLPVFVAIGGCSSTLPVPPDSTGQAGAVIVNQPDRHRRSGVAGSRAADSAVAMLGAPYRFGGSTPTGFDCSGLVHYAYGTVGITVPRTTMEQLRASRGIRLREVREGDLLFFEIESPPDHVGIYIGNGRFVHAPSAGGRVSIQDLDDPYWQRNFLGARRFD